MKSLNGLMDQMGIGNHIYEIFVDETESILKQILDAIQGGVQDESFLVDAFNEGYTADAIVTHFRVRILLGDFVDSCLIFDMDISNGFLHLWMNAR